MRTMFVSLLLALTTSAQAATWEVDPTHSQVGFAVSHLMISTVRGSFGTVSGTVEYDPARPVATRVSGTVGVASVDTNNGDRDKHLASADFFDVAKFPEMSFRSRSVRNVTKAGFELVGDLTIRGVTREMVFTVDRLAPEMKDPWGNVKSATSATATINRHDFGVSWNANLDGGGYVVGDEVVLTLDLELVRK